MRRSIASVQRSAGELPKRNTQIYVADTIGELGTFYSLMPIALIGGSLIERGGQNPIEAVRFDTNVITGPDQSNFADAYRELLRHRGAVQVTDAATLAQTVGLLRDVGAQFAYVNIFEDPEIREGLKTYSNWPTFPQLYVNGELIGGCDIAMEMHESGELKQLIDSVPEQDIG